MVSQQSSTKGAAVAQLELLPPANKVSPPVDKAYLLTLPTLRRAIRYSVSLADLEHKDIYEPLDMDKAVWSRIENGSMSFPADELCKLASITRNQAPLMWLAHQTGHELRPLRSDLERRCAELESQLAQERHDKQVILSALREIRR
jgi:hypothetical protein